MKIRANFNERVLVHSDTLDWVKSPMAGVDRRPLDRVGDEVARATSIVRYAPNSHFSPHMHTGGEEFLVLSGVFQDEHGDFPAGSYIRNPPQSSHTPRSDNGCVIFVKLWQFQLEDRTHVRKKLTDLNFVNQKEDTAGKIEVAEAVLYEDDFETVKLIKMRANASLSLAAKGGLELLVLEGELHEQEDTLRSKSWLRLPLNSQLKATAGPKGATVWLKSGHLRDVDNQISKIFRQMDGLSKKII